MNKILIFSLFALIVFTNKAQAQQRLTQHYITVSCKAFTKTYSGQKVSKWTSGKCGAVVTFRDSNYPLQTFKRYVACTLPVKDSTQTTCEVTKTYDQLLIPVSYFAVTEASAPELPNLYPTAGAWYGYAKSPLVSVTTGKYRNIKAGNRHDVYNVEHELLADF